MTVALDVPASPAHHEASPPRTLDPALSDRLRFWSLMAMVLLVYVHAFNLHPRYLQPFTLVEEAATWDHALQYLLSNGVLRFRIPVLFAISGYLLAWRDDGRQPHRARIGRRFRTLIVPYLAWSAVSLAFTWALESWEPTRGLVRAASLSIFGPEHPFVSGYDAQQLAIRLFAAPVAFQLWYLRSLFFLVVLYPALRWAAVRAPKIFFPLAVLAWLPGGGVLFIESEGLLFFTLGVWLAARDTDVTRPPAWMDLRILALVWIGASVAQTTMAFAWDTLTGPRATGMLLLHRSAEVAGLLFAWYGLADIAGRAMQRRWVRTLTGFSFIIYVLHVPLLHYLTEAGLAYGAGTPHLSLLVYLLAPLVVIAVAIGTGASMRRLLPGVYATMTGGRGLA